MAVDPSRLFSQLLNTGLQSKDQNLYQLLYQMIGTLSQLNADVSSSSSGSGGSSSVINPITLVGNPIPDEDNSEEAILLQLLQTTEIVGPGGDLIRGEIPPEIPDGVIDTFSTANNYSELAVYVNGVRQLKDVDYTETALNQFTFTAGNIPLTGDIVTDDYGTGGTIGPQGPPGNTGAPGSAGINGLNGVVGLDGLDGEDFFPIPGPPGINGTIAGAFAKVYRSSNFSISTDTETTITWSASIYDDNGFFSGGSPTKLIVPSDKAGKYVVNIQATLAVFLGTGLCTVKLYRNGTVVCESSMVTTGFASTQPTIVLSAQVDLSVGDELTATIYIEDSMALNHTVIGGSTATTFACGTMGGTGGGGGTSLTAGDGIDITSGVVSAVVDSNTLGLSASGLKGKGRVLLEEIDVSGLTNVDLTTFYSSDYDEFILEFVNLVWAGGQQPIIQCSTDGGTTYDSGANYAETALWTYTASSGVYGGALSNIRFRDTDTTLIGSGACCAYFRLFDNGSEYKTFIGEATAIDSIGGMLCVRMYDVYKNTAVVDALRFKLASGSAFTSGFVRAYGLVNS